MKPYVTSGLPVAMVNMMDQAHIEDPKLAEMVRRLVKGLKPDAVYLFGSLARGEGSQESDYDLLVVVPNSDLPGYKRDQQAFRILCGVGASKDVIVLTREEFERKRKVACSLPATVDREGRVVYAAGKGRGDPGLAEKGVV